MIFGICLGSVNLDQTVGATHRVAPTCGEGIRIHQRHKNEQILLTTRHLETR